MTVATFFIPLTVAAQPIEAEEVVSPLVIEEIDPQIAPAVTDENGNPLTIMPVTTGEETVVGGSQVGIAVLPASENPDSLASWLWWAVGGGALVVLVVLIMTMAGSKKKTAPAANTADSEIEE